MKSTYLYAILISTIFIHDSSAQFSVTTEDYERIMHNVGMSAGAGTKTDFEIGSAKFEWTFDWAAVPLPYKPKISLFETSQDKTIFKYKVEGMDLAPTCYPQTCEFTLKLLNPESVVSSQEISLSRMIEPSNFSITKEDYKNIMDKVGMSAGAGTKTDFEIGSAKFEWTFDWAAVPLPHKPKISLFETSQENTIFKYKVEGVDLAPTCSPQTCEFTLKLLNPETVVSTQKIVLSSMIEPLSISPILLKKQPSQLPKIKGQKPKVGSIGYFKNVYGSYPPQEAQLFKVGQFVLTTLDPQYGDESGRLDNTPNKKQECELSMHAGYLFNRDGTLFATDGPRKACNDHGEFIWVLSKKGKVYATTMYGDISKGAIGNQHSFFLKSEGYGKPIAAGGHIKAIKGKITELDNGSGHYKPNSDQLLLAAHYFYTQNLLAETVIIKNHVMQTTYNLSDIAKINPQDILAKYKELV